MPPASPVPGWSSGDVCTLIIATRRTASASVNPTAYLLERARTSGSNPLQPRGGSRDPRRPGAVSEGGPWRGAAVGEPKAGDQPADSAEDGVDHARVGGRLVKDAEPAPHQRRQGDAHEDAQGEEVAAHEHQPQAEHG